MRSVLICLLLAACSTPPLTDAPSVGTDASDDRAIVQMPDAQPDVVHDVARVDVPGDVTIDGPADTGSACGADALLCPGSCGDRCIDNVIGCAPDGGSCSITCPAGRGDCNGQSADGCETDFSTSQANCGGCGHGCGMHPCVASVCN